MMRNWWGVTATFRMQPHGEMLWPWPISDKTGWSPTDAIAFLRAIPENPCRRLTAASRSRRIGVVRANHRSCDRFRPPLSGQRRRTALSPNRLPALIDTGAGKLHRCLACLRVEPTGCRPPGTDCCQRRCRRSVHLAQIYIPDLDTTIYGQFASVNLTEGEQTHYALIGRTFLRHFSMAYEGRTGSVIISND